MFLPWKVLASPGHTMPCNVYLQTKTLTNMNGVKILKWLYVKGAMPLKKGRNKEKFLALLGKKNTTKKVSNLFDKKKSSTSYLLSLLYTYIKFMNSLYIIYIIFWELSSKQWNGVMYVLSSNLFIIRRLQTFHPAISMIDLYTVLFTCKRY